MRYANPLGLLTAGAMSLAALGQSVNIDFKRSGGTYTGTLSFDRTKFGLIYGSQSFFKSLLADKIIADEISVSFELEVESPKGS